MRARPRQIRLRLNPDNPLHLPVYQWVKQMEKKGGRIVQAHLLAILSQYIAAQSLAGSSGPGSNAGSGVATGTVGRRTAPPVLPVEVVPVDRFMGVPAEHEPVITVGDDDDLADEHVNEVSASPVADLIDPIPTIKSSPVRDDPVLTEMESGVAPQSPEITPIEPPVVAAEKSLFKPKASQSARLLGGFGGVSDEF